MFLKSQNLVVKFFMTEEFDMNSKEIKNIKKPSYAVSLCKGLFAGANWMCIKCGKQVNGGSMPPQGAHGKCPDTASGNHVWQQC